MKLLGLLLMTPLVLFYLILFFYSVLGATQDQAMLFGISSTLAIWGLVIWNGWWR